MATTRKARPALGRGLGALISAPTPERTPANAPTPASQEPDAAAPLYIAVDRISPNRDQPRKHFDEGEIEGMASSIREFGILQPLVVRSRPGGYQLIIGERRWRAAQQAGLREVPAVVLDASDRAVIEMALVENVQRADLNPMELARAFRVLTEDEGMTHEKVGQRVGLDRVTISNHLRLLELSPELQQDLATQVLSMGHAKAILQAPEAQRQELRDRVVREGLSVRATEELSRRSALGASSSASNLTRGKPKRDLHLVALEDRMRATLSTRVRIVGRPEKGRIELHYFGPDELERLSARLLGGSE